VTRADPRRRAGGCEPGRRDGPRSAAGFTLIEVLLATVLLSAGLALAFATLTAATKTANRGEVLAQRSERLRAVEGFMRRRLASARPVPFAIDEETALPQRFFGEAGRMRFVADLPDYLGRGGPYLHEFAVEPDGRDYRVTLALAPVQAGITIEEREPPPPELLVEELRSARFRYRGLRDDGQLDEWTDAWKKADQLPLMVEVTLVDADGGTWPPLVVALPQAASYGSGAP